VADGATVPKSTDPQQFVLRVTRRIAEVRRERGVTQEELAARLGMAVRGLQRIEAGQNITLHTLARIASALDVRPDELLATPGVG